MCRKCENCLYEIVSFKQAPCITCGKKRSNWVSNNIELLLKQLEIVIDHCNETGLKAGAGAVKEAIKLLKEGDMP